MLREAPARARPREIALIATLRPHSTSWSRHLTVLPLQTDPDMSREGGSIPVTITLQEASGRNVLLLPMGAGDDMAHSQNEKLNVRNYIEGVSDCCVHFKIKYLLF